MTSLRRNFHSGVPFSIENHKNEGLVIFEENKVDLMKLGILYIFDTRNPFFVYIFKKTYRKYLFVTSRPVGPPNFPNQLKALKVVNKSRSKVGIWGIDQRKNEVFGGFNQI